MPVRLLCAIGLLFFPALAFAEEPAPLWWSFQPITAPKAPAGVHPVDHFIQSRLHEKGLTLSPEADRRTVIRRVTFDLTGLPPTPVEVDAFIADRSPQAYEKLVDRLLASTAYGERMARLWMDAVHFAETHGHDQDRVRPNAWRYRDYLINAFNRDTPYSRFVQEQIAADVLFPNEPKLTPALGFLAAGPWDESSLRDIREDSIDREVGRYLDRDDIVTTVFNTFQGLTVQCARCHDHKFDPIPQDDYYRLQAVFAGVGRGDVPYELDAAVAKKRKESQARLAALARKDAGLYAELDSPRMKKAVDAWEARHAGAAVEWVVPEFARVESTDGSKLVKQPDGSFRSEGPRPDKDTYNLTARLRSKRITAVRLELLADDSLPHGGPGRCDNGNLHLSEFHVLIPPGGDRVKPVPLKLRAASSDFDQAGWTIAHAIDDNTATAWGIYPQVGKPHEAVFELAEPAGGENQPELILRLEQLHGGGHLIGRFRLSVTSAAPPLKVALLPEAIRAILATPADRRSIAQTRELAAHLLREETTRELGALPAPGLVYAAGPNFLPDNSHKPTATPREVRVLKRGNIRTPGAKADPGAISCLPQLPGDFKLKTASEGERRAALARWITSDKNPLTWRVMANRVWQQHFGRGLVDSPNDFGKMGQKPTHPELLDFLAAELREHGSLKQLHRLIVTSAIYKQSSASREEGLKADEDNHLLWRQNRTRLDAEEVRDAILAVSGRLDRTMGGPSDMQFDMKPGIHVTPKVDYGKFDWDRPQGHRRSIYRFVFRTLPDPLVECLDGADASQLTPKRTESVTAPQALALLNDEFILVHAKAMAARLEKHSPDRAKQLDLACRLAWGRAQTADEASLFTAYSKKHGLANLCRVLFNTNEFLFAD